MESISQNLDITNYTCPICLNLTIQPVKTECNHLFCNFCLEELMDNSPDLEDFKCPMCRCVFSKSYIPIIEKQFDEYLLKSFPEEYIQRKKLIDDQLKSIEQYKKIKILFGNRHELITNPKQSRSNSECVNKHRWTCFVEIAGEPDASKLIKKVIFGMHPTFGCSEVNVTQSPFRISRIGWGTFEIPIKIYFHQSKQVVNLSHYLSFDGEGKTSVYILKVKK